MFHDMRYNPIPISPEWQEYWRRLMNPGAESGWYDYPTLPTTGQRPIPSQRPMPPVYGDRPFKPLAGGSWGSFLTGQPASATWMRQQTMDAAKAYASQRLAQGPQGPYTGPAQPAFGRGRYTPRY